MEQVNVSPRVTYFEWGRLDIEGYDAPFKDAKLYPGGAREWDWNETGMRHNPGILPGDVEELLEAGAAVVVLSKGVEEKLGTHAETLDLLASHGVEVHILQTERAIEKYNGLATEGLAVGALIHSTC
jgi:hypothetical protein